MIVHRSTPTRRHPRSVLRAAATTAIVALLAGVLLADAAFAQSGVQLTPDGARTLVSKDVAGQRWAITRNPDGTVTGNVFSPGGGAPQFVWCEQRASSATSVDLACSGASACLQAPCSDALWTFIADVSLPLSFFATGASGTVAALDGIATPTPMIRLAFAARAAAASPASGLQRTPDGKRTLISKDVGDQRWAISRNEDGTVTGNVFFPGGGEPQFVWCEQLSEARDVVSLRCLGAGACGRDASDPCSATDWTLIAEVELPVEFFQPSEILDLDAFAALLNADLGGEDGAAAAAALAFERGYTLEQIIAAGLERRLRASGEIVLATGGVETPSGPPLDLFLDEPAATGLARPAAISLSSFLNKLKGSALGQQVLVLVVLLVDQGYSIEQILTELFFADSRLETVDGKTRLLEPNGAVVKPDGPPRYLLDKCGNGKRDSGEDCEGTSFATGQKDCSPGQTGSVTCTSTCTVDKSQCRSAAVCGNGILEFPESCDGAAITAECQGGNRPGGPRPVCSVFCQVDYLPCTLACAQGGFCCPDGEKRCGDECIPSSAACCGDGDRSGAELCDGTDLGGATCASIGQGTGTLFCSASCTYDAGDCTGGGSCGAGTFPCEGGCAPNGADCCEGEQGYCAAGSVCVGDLTCCPSASPKLCGNQCLPASASCCGNDVIETGEVCDGSAGCDAGETCDSCDSCTAPQTCGNGVREGSEVCDGADGCDAGAACSSGCSACTATQTCGNGVREGSEVCDPPGSTASCGAGNVCGGDCASCVSTTSCEGRCCAGRDDSCTPPGVGCYCDDYCVTAGDCCGDFGSSCG